VIVRELIAQLQKVDGDFEVRTPNDGIVDRVVLMTLTQVATGAKTHYVYLGLVDARNMAPSA
jgi:hypothetical protein